MHLSLTSLFTATATMLLLVGPPAASAACTPGRYMCQDQYEGNYYESNILVCNSAGDWKLSARCAPTYGRPGCRVVNGGQSAYCVA